MKKNSEIVMIANGIHEEIAEGIKKVAAVKGNIADLTAGKSMDEKGVIFAGCVEAVEAIVKAPKVEGVGLPDFLSKLAMVEGTDDYVDITVRTKLKHSYKYIKTVSVSVDADFIQNLANVYTSALFDMFYIDAALENVGELNACIKEICEKNDITIIPTFDVDVDSDAMVLAVTDDAVVFNANISRAHDIASLGILNSGDEYSDFVREKAVETLVDALKTIQTPAQLIKSGIDIITTVTGVKTKKKASKLIRESYHRQAKFLGKVKSGLGYFNETVKVGKEEVDVFAIVEKKEDGTLELVLKPFDTKTLFNVEYDVIKNVKKQLA